MENIEKVLSVKNENSNLTPIDHPLLVKHDIQLSIKRDDLLHPIISGNKWRKLKYILQDAISSGHNHLISMGGAYSNHLHALAYIGYKLNIKTTGLIRGEYDQNNPTLNDLRKWNMNCIFFDRKSYRELRKFRDPASAPAQQYNGYWIPEGGANPLALKGISELITGLNQDYDTITLASGTGTSLAGIAGALPEGKNAIGFAALKGAGFLNKEVQEMINLNSEKNRNADKKELKKNWSINLDYHFGGFGKTDQNLIKFIKEFTSHTQLQIEPVYTGKMFYGLFDQIQRGEFKRGSKVIAIHTGGLQGER
ncbi:MAG: 1-aminocyclopropane-1-carboxylate deaminase/D-cysteine desulfhydrase [Gammaproteobacteria bacterium]